MTSRMTGPRRLPTWTVPDGVLLSLTTWGPLTLAASWSAQSSGGCPCGPAPSTLPGACCPIRSPAVLGDRDDLVREVARGDLHDDLLALLLAEQGAANRALVADPTFSGTGL